MSSCCWATRCSSSSACTQVTHIIFVALACVHQVSHSVNLGLITLLLIFNFTHFYFLSLPALCPYLHPFFQHHSYPLLPQHILNVVISHSIVPNLVTNLFILILIMFIILSFIIMLLVLIRIHFLLVLMLILLLLIFYAFLFFLFLPHLILIIILIFSLHVFSPALLP